MTNNLYSIYDKKASIYGDVFTSINNATAIRRFNELVEDKSTTVHMFPSDFSLVHLGTCDTETAVIESKNPEIISEASSFKQE